jgi:hypothetical protein
MLLASFCILTSFASNPDNIKELVQRVKREYATEYEEVAGSEEAQKLTESSTRVDVIHFSALFQESLKLEAQ